MKNNYFKAIGELTPTIFKSTYIIPLKHYFFKQNDKSMSVFKEFNKLNWHLANNTAKEELFLYDIKSYLLDTFFPKILEINGKNISQSYKSLYLKNTKFTQLKLMIQKDNKQFKTDLQFDLYLDSIDLWILDDNISLFAIHISNQQDTNYTINEYSSIVNRVLRNYQTLYAYVEDETLLISINKVDNNQIKLIDLLIDLTRLSDKKSFLNIDKQNYNDTIINQSTYYAKMLTSIYVDKQDIKIDNNKINIVKNYDMLTEEVLVDFDYFDEIPYLLSTTSTFNFIEEPSFISHKKYMYKNLENSNINIWQNWVGIGLQDSCSFFSVKNGGAMIVNSNSTSNYFLYIMNIVTNIKLKIYEQEVIDDDFINVHKIYPLKRKLQKLKNQFIANEISIKFQPSHIYNKMEKGLGNKEILDEISSNIDTTLDLTKQNTDTFISVGAILFTAGSFWEPISYGYKHNPTLTLSIMIGAIIGMITIIYKRNQIFKTVKNSIHWFNNKFNN